MDNVPNNGFALVIDTNEYAGNFEREMTAFLTGKIGECGVGEDLVEDLPISFGNIMNVADDSGCYRPTTCYPSPNDRGNDSVAIFFETKPTDEQISFIKERIKLFDNAQKTKSRMKEFNQNSPAIEILGYRLIEFKQEKIEVTI